MDTLTWKRQDKAYHEDQHVVQTFDRRIIRKYRLEHKYYTLEKWIDVLVEKKATDVLDVGCATGTASLALARRGLHAFALDASHAMLEEVQRKAKLESLHVACVLGDAEQMPFTDKQFDGVICMGVLHHLHDIEKGIEEQIRVLKKGGILFISEPFWHRPWFSLPYHACVEALRWVLRAFKGKFLSTPERLLTHDHLNQIKTILDRQGLVYDIEFFVYWPNVIVYLPQRLGLGLVRFLNRMNQGSNRGDSVFISVRKP